MATCRAKMLSFGNLSDWHAKLRQIVRSSAVKTLEHHQTEFIARDHHCSSVCTQCCCVKVVWLVTCRKHSALAYHNNKSAPVCYVASDIFSREYVIIFLSDNYFTPVGEAKYCNDCVCLCLFVCLSVHNHISGTTRPIFTHFCACSLWPWLSRRPAA